MAQLLNLTQHLQMKLLGRKRQLTQEVIEEAFGRSRGGKLVLRVVSGLIIEIRGRKDEGRNVEKVTKIKRKTRTCIKMKIYLFGGPETRDLVCAP
jgi:hypothetical protein